MSSSRFDQAKYNGTYYVNAALVGGLSRGITHPILKSFDVVSEKFKSTPNSLGTLGKVVIKDGSQTITAGYQTTFLHHFTKGLLKFSGVEFYKIKAIEILGEDLAYDYHGAIYFGSAAASKITSDFLLNNLESNFLNSNQRQTMNPIQRLIQSEGNSLFSRILTVFNSRIPYTMTQFGMQGIVSTQMFKWFEINPHSATGKEKLNISLGSGYIAGALASIVSNPADSILSHVYKNGPGEKISCVGRLKSISKQIGFKELVLAGLGPRSVLKGLITAVEFTLYDQIFSLTGSERFHFHYLHHS
ncbi:hypothetical protein HDV02_001672 [Globomyces sp. JEL0801]|nr:hypothetical protein HDV02_001672 [Globomyces sp. JEL0801]